MELFIAIAALCGNPGYTRLGEEDVLKCQRNLTQCVINENKSPESPLYKLSNKEYVINALSKCVLKRTEWKGE